MIVTVSDPGAPGSNIRIEAPLGGSNFWISFNRFVIVLDYLIRSCRVCLAAESSSDFMSLLYM